MVMRNAKGKYTQEDIEFTGDGEVFNDLLVDIETQELEKELQDAIAKAEKENALAETKTETPKPGDVQGKTAMQFSAEEMAKAYIKNLYRFCRIAGYVIGGTVFGIVIVVITSALTVRAIVKRITKR
jgi:hypothetical protein